MEYGIQYMMKREVSSMNGIWYTIHNEKRGELYEWNMVYNT